MRDCHGLGEKEGPEFLVKGMRAFLGLDGNTLDLDCDRLVVT